jgi:sulfur carrier protein|tara:strand:+ start:183 stop:395 length:213 start_codon:yes stop_codon:yes gene_type:complete
MKIKVNGKEQNFDKDSLSVSELLNLSKVEKPEMVSVQLNGEFVKKEDLEKTNLKENDEVEFLYFMGGGIN